MIQEMNKAKKPHTFKFMQVRMGVKARAKAKTKAKMNMSDSEIDNMINNLQKMKQINHSGANLNLNPSSDPHYTNNRVEGNINSNNQSQIGGI